MNIFKKFQDNVKSFFGEPSANKSENKLKDFDDYKDQTYRDLFELLKEGSTEGAEIIYVAKALKEKSKSDMAYIESYQPKTEAGALRIAMVDYSAEYLSENAGKYASLVMSGKKDSEKGREFLKEIEENINYLVGFEDKRMAGNEAQKSKPPKPLSLQ